MSEQNTDYGIVYVLSNPAMQGLVKIGMTTREDINIRMQELFNTSVPVPFVCEYACKVLLEDCNKIERALHIAFDPSRINPSREFFEIVPEQAIAILQLLDRTEDITTEVIEKSESTLSATDKEAGRKMKQKRRPPLNYLEMGIPVGSKLQYGDNESVIEVEVASDRKVIYEGEETSLTAVVRQLMDLEYSIQPTPYWYFEGRRLSEIYDETYSGEE